MFEINPAKQQIVLIYVKVLKENIADMRIPGPSVSSCSALSLPLQSIMLLFVEKLVELSMFVHFYVTFGYWVNYVIMLPGLF